MLPTSPVPSPIPFSERDRLQALYRTELLESAPDAAFDALTVKAAELFDSPIALISLVDRHRQWFLSKVGLTIDESPRSASLCSHAILGSSNDVLFVPDARLDGRFQASHVVIEEPFIRFYAGAPIITRDGQTIGVLCVLDPVPRQNCSEHQRAGLRSLASEASAIVNARLEAKSQGPTPTIEPIDAYVGQRLYQLRLQLSVTQSRLAFELGVSMQPITRMEEGDIRIPAAQLLI